MDDLVVIILTLLIAGAGLIGQLKKKKQLDSAPPEEQKNPENIWDLLREEAFPSVQKEEHEYLIVEPQESEPYENEQGYKFEPKNEGGKLINNELKTETPAQEIIKKRKEGFSLRNAVIYSEILNRKYI
jgi:hypothetical protein